MNVAVRYFSGTGNTKKVADAVARALGVTAETMSYPVSGVDLLFIGTPIHAGKLPYEVSSFFEDIGPARVKKVVAFGTSMGGKSPAPLISRLVAPRGIKMAGESYACPGKYLLFKKGRPNDGDIAAAAEFAKRVLENESSAAEA
ncbi:MAG: flavodoxin [Oscillospiraceae bacterium]|jgi:flavodoxin|nr:flavodoxin [Oscillospiraceae bacterium]